MDNSSRPVQGSGFSASSLNFFISAGVKALAIAASVQLFRSGLRRHGIRLAFGTAPS